MNVRRAGQDDAATVADRLDQATRWVHELGFEQWPLPGAVYVHKLAVSRDRAGRGIGAAIVAWANAGAAKAPDGSSFDSTASATIPAFVTTTSGSASSIRVTSCSTAAT